MTFPWETSEKHGYELARLHYGHSTHSLFPRNEEIFSPTANSYMNKRKDPGEDSLGGAVDSATCSEWRDPYLVTWWTEKSDSLVLLDFSFALILVGDVGISFRSIADNTNFSINRTSSEHTGWCGTDVDTVKVHRKEVHHYPSGRKDRCRPVAVPFNDKGGTESRNLTPKGRVGAKVAIRSDNGGDCRVAPEGPTDPSSHS